MMHTFFSSATRRSLLIMGMLSVSLTACSVMQQESGHQHAPEQQHQPQDEGRHEPSTMPHSVLRVFKSLGGVQCEPGAKTPADLVGELNAAGVRVKQAACGTDGKMYPAACGGPDGRIAIMEIDEEDAEKAAGLGFSPLSTLPEARPTFCR